MKNSKTIGKLGEGFAKGYLERSGFKVLRAPFRCRSGEIDIIALDRDILVFVEVKTRRSTRFGSPLEAVTVSKQKQIIKVARYYLAYADETAFKTCRFDVLGITQGKPGTPPKIVHVKDAFRVDSGL